MKKSLLGKHINSTEAKMIGWCNEWPIIDRDGIITGSYDGDLVPDDAVLVDWSTDTMKGRLIIVDGNHGFEAVLDPKDEQVVRFSNAAAMLGSITSKRKAAASRRNGRKGGRPKIKA